MEQLGIAGSGTIACGLAVAAARHGDVMLWARSDKSADRARSSVAKLCAKAQEELDAGRVQVVTGLDELAASATFLVEAVVEDHGTRPRCCPSSPATEARTS